MKRFQRKAVEDGVPQEPELSDPIEPLEFVQTPQEFNQQSLEDVVNDEPSDDNLLVAADYWEERGDSKKADGYRGIVGGNREHLYDELWQHLPSNYGSGVYPNGSSNAYDLNGIYQQIHRAFSTRYSRYDSHFREVNNLLHVLTHPNQTQLDADDLIELTKLLKLAIRNDYLHKE